MFRILNWTKSVKMMKTIPAGNENPRRKCVDARWARKTHNFPQFLSKSWESSGAQNSVNNSELKVISQRAQNVEMQ